jgi:hypothetical protein
MRRQAITCSTRGALCRGRKKKCGVITTLIGSQVADPRKREVGAGDPISSIGRGSERSLTLPDLIPARWLRLM